MLARQASLDVGSAPYDTGGGKISGRSDAACSESVNMEKVKKWRKSRVEKKGRKAWRVANAEQGVLSCRVDPRRSGSRGAEESKNKLG